MPVTADVPARLPEILAAAAEDSGGALWRLAAEPRQLDANLVRIAPHGGVGAHREQVLDVLLYVAEGGGTLLSGGREQPLTPGTVVWLPRGCERALSAGPGGLVYLTAHPRRPGLSIQGAGTGPAAAAQGGEAACQLHRVCADCGRLAGESDARYCARCGAALPHD
ncbi:cupin domain-containing protein [Streptomyces physcomitrii]|uniref:Cupin domain-containing protein n=1 Tax=Streptomyces physcomitrii TaxID=2724184 RepID=A0ABX1H9V9_9ACTN|nr:cupin domain-containing protein [Streptomyces physcomitrii]